MSYRNKLQYLLVKKLTISNKQAKEIIESNTIKINNLYVNYNQEVLETDRVEWRNEIIQTEKKLIYIAFYKPRGIESTLNGRIENNLNQFIPNTEKLFPIGRLDKESEGLIILTNNGYLFNKTINPKNKIEKEYIVNVNKPITNEFIDKMSRGVEILGKTTLPCFVEQIDTLSFKIILIQGMNRQIRRMCYKFNYIVTSLKRIRIGNVLLKELEAGQTREILINELE